MKRIVSFVAALALFVALSANAQSYTAQTGTLASPLIQASTATNTTGTFVIDARKAQNVGIQFKYQTDAANTAAVNLYLVPSVDGVTYDTTRLIGLHTAAVSAGTTVCFTTNLATGGIGYWKLAYMTNANASANCTNVSLKYSLKLNAP